MTMAVEHSEDLELAKAVARGGESAFRRFFDLYFARVYRFALSRTGGNPALCEEVTMHVLSQAIRKIHTFRGEASLFTWLCQICRHEIASQLARESRRERYVTLLDDHPEVRGMLESMESEVQTTPDVALIRNEEGELVHLVLDHLPGDYGNVLEWKYVDGASVKEIAIRLETTPIAVQSMLARARVAFRTQYAAVHALVSRIATEEQKRGDS